MALEHALLVALREQPASGLDLTRRFEKSIGHFWSASHQQIYRTLARMEADGWVVSQTVAQEGRPDKKVCSVTERGTEVLRDWLSQDSPAEPMRSSLAVRMRAASYGERDAVLATVARHRDERRERLAVYEHFLHRDYPDPAALRGQQLDQYLVLRGGVLTEQAWISWLTEYLHAHEGTA